jgi:hypothetical protein
MTALSCGPFAPNGFGQLSLGDLPLVQQGFVEAQRRRLFGSVTLQQPMPLMVFTIMLK